jgi:hypothetical protein
MVTLFDGSKNMRLPGSVLEIDQVPFGVGSMRRMAEISSLPSCWHMLIASSALAVVISLRLDFFLGAEGELFWRRCRMQPIKKRGE